MTAPQAPAPLSAEQEARVREIVREELFRDRFARSMRDQSDLTRRAGDA